MQLYRANIVKMPYKTLPSKLKNNSHNTVQFCPHFLAAAILMVSLLEIDVASRQIGLLVSKN